MVFHKHAAAFAQPGFDDGLGGAPAGSFSLRLLAHNREPATLEVPRGMTLGELARNQGLSGWAEVSAINPAGTRLRAGNVLRPEDDPITITGRLSGAVE